MWICYWPLYLISPSAGAVPAHVKVRRKKRRWVLPDGRRFYGTDAEAARLVAQIRAFQERLKAEAKADKPKIPTKRTAKAKKAKPKPIKPIAIFDIPAELARKPAVEFPLETVYLSEVDLKRAINAADMKEEKLRALEAEMATIREWQKREEEDIEMLLMAA